MDVYCDFDGTLADSVNEMVNMANEHLKKKIDIKDWITFNPADCFDKDAVAQLSCAWNKVELYSRCKMKPFAREFSRQLQKGGHRLFIWSDCHTTGINIARAKLDMLMNNDIIYDYPAMTFTKEKKLPIDALLLSGYENICVIEDNAETLANVIAGLKILIDAPWNKDFDEKAMGIYRVKNLKEALVLIQKTETEILKTKEKQTISSIINNSLLTISSIFLAISLIVSVTRELLMENGPAWLAVLLLFAAIPAVFIIDSAATLKDKTKDLLFFRKRRKNNRVEKNSKIDS